MLLFCFLNVMLQKSSNVLRCATGDGNRNIIQSIRLAILLHCLNELWAPAFHSWLNSSLGCDTARWAWTGRRSETSQMERNGAETNKIKKTRKMRPESLAVVWCHERSFRQLQESGEDVLKTCVGSESLCSGSCMVLPKHSNSVCEYVFTFLKGVYSVSFQMSSVTVFRQDPVYTCARP